MNWFRVLVLLPVVPCFYCADSGNNPNLASSQVVTTSDTGYTNYGPRISGHRIVWYGHSSSLGWAVFYFDGISSSIISDGHRHDETPVINDTTIAWACDTSGQMDIYVKTPGVGSRCISCDIPDAYSNPVISGSIVAFTGKVAYLYNGSSTLPVSAGRVFPNGQNGRLVWFDNDGTQLHVYEKDGTTWEIDSISSGKSGTTDGSRIVWVETFHDSITGESEDDVVLYENGARKRLRTGGILDLSPSISPEMIAWSGMDTSRFQTDIYCYCGDSVVQLTRTPGYSEVGPSGICGRRAVWFAWIEQDYEVFLFDGVTVRQLTSNDNKDRDPDVSEDRVVWSQDNKIVWTEQ